MIDCYVLNCVVCYCVWVAWRFILFIAFDLNVELLVCVLVFCCFANAVEYVDPDMFLLLDDYFFSF